MTTLDLSRHVRAGDTLTWGQSHAEPRRLVQALIEQRHAIGRTRLFLGIGQAGDLGPEHADAFDFLSYCGSGTNRRLASEGLIDILPVHYSSLPTLLSQPPLKVDVLFLQVSPPDDQGRHSLGMAREYLLEVLRNARVVIGEVNPDVPWTFGGPYLMAEDFTALVTSDAPLSESAPARIGEIELAIGRHAAELIEDGATLQVGIGTIPDAVLAQLRDRRDLGVHSGAIGDGIAALCEAGVVTNARKEIDKGVTVAGSLMGGAALRAYAHRNPALEMRGAEYTHAAEILGRLDRFVALNSAIEVDLSGQVNSEMARGVYVGAVGGIVDFLRAAGASKGGTPIVALPSTAGAHSRIVSRIDGPVTAARSEPVIVVTEYGVADLRGLTLSQRARRLIAIAHPEHREALEREAQATVSRLR
ncbi:MAG: acetyl-CoA hydrolase/transferase family protein [Hyphomicrobiales bacterium]|nr:MAG: acetyl-CoA hydrolase/transferase family protein [Hyphomicrobiales bacterium]